MRWVGKEGEVGRCEKKMIGENKKLVDAKKQQ